MGGYNWSFYVTPSTINTVYIKYAGAADSTAITVINDGGFSTGSFVETNTVEIWADGYQRTTAIVGDSPITLTPETSAISCTRDATQDITGPENLIDANTLYLCTDSGEIYLGSTLISNKTNGKDIGDVVFSLTPKIDAGLHLLDGALIQGGGIYSAFVTYIAGLVSTYPNLFVTESAWQSAVTTYGVCGKFVYDSTNDTVRLPKITGILEGTTDVSALGDLVEAGLPNITGDANTDQETGHGPSGAFYRSGSYSVGGLNGTYNRPNLFFDASLSNSIYGNSSTVQPQTIKAFYYIVIATSTKTDIQVDIDEIATDLNSKADVDLSNTTDTGHIKMAKASMPSNKYIDLTLNANGSTYIAPADGYVVLEKVNGTNASRLAELATDGIATISFAPYSVNPSTVFLPVKKGNVFSAFYDSTGEVRRFRFVYAEGSESEAN